MWKELEVLLVVLHSTHGNIFEIGKKHLHVSIQIKYMRALFWLGIQDSIMSWVNGIGGKFMKGMKGRCFLLWCGVWEGEATCWVFDFSSVLCLSRIDGLYMLVWSACSGWYMKRLNHTIRRWSYCINNLKNNTPHHSQPLPDTCKMIQDTFYCLLERKFLQ